MASVHELGSGGKALQLEDSGTHHAKKAVKLRSRIAALNEQMRQVKRGLNRERHRRSSYGGAAASKQSKRREMAQLNQLESTLQMWTVRACDVSTKNDLLRDKINQKDREVSCRFAHSFHVVFGHSFQMQVQRRLCAVVPDKRWLRF